MVWRLLAIVSVPLVVAALVVESLAASLALALAAVLCAGVGLLVPAVKGWKASRPIAAPPREEPTRVDRSTDHG